MGKLFDTSDFPARWHCGTWSEVHGWTHITSDFFIFLAYLAIPVSITILLRRRRLPFPAIGWLFVVFITSCGIGHLLEAVIFYWPIYRVAAVVKVITAAASVATVFALVAISPRLLNFPQLAALNTQLRQSQRTLARRNEEMERFVSIVSHDLRTPLVTISGFASNLRLMLEKDDLKRAAHSIDRIENAAKSMDQLVSDILLHSEIRPTAHDPARLTEVDLNTVAHKVIENRADAIRQADFEVRLVDKLPTVRGIHQEFERIFDNLIGNALKYGSSVDGKPSRIEIGCRAWTPDDSEFEVYVKDFGAGIDPAYHQKIFQLFEKLDSVQSGSGVGLASVAKLLDAHGGSKVWVESAPGKGATFHFNIKQIDSSIPEEPDPTHEIRTDNLVPVGRG